MLIAAEDGKAFEESVQRLAMIQLVPVTTTMVRAVEFAMRELAFQSTGAHRIPVVDYFVAAAAESLGGAVLHYDRHFDKLAEVLTFKSVWLAPPGSIS